MPIPASRSASTGILSRRTRDVTANNFDHALTAALGAPRDALQTSYRPFGPLTAEGSGRRDSNSVRATRQHAAPLAESCYVQVFPGNRLGLARLPWKQLGSAPDLIQTFSGGSEHLRIRAVPSTHGRHLDAAQFSLVSAVGKLGSCES